MPDFVQTIVKHLRLPIPVRKDLPSDLISLIELEDITITLPRDCPHPLVTGLIRTEVRIPTGLHKISFITTGIKAKFYLLHPKTKERIAQLETDGWHESSSDQDERVWKIEARVKEAPVEIIEGQGFYEWIGMMLALEEEFMRICVEGWCTVGIKLAGTKVELRKLPVKASLNLPGIPKPGQLDPKCQNDVRVTRTSPTDAEFSLHIYVNNTTPYTLNIDYIHVHLFHEDVLIGEAWISNCPVKPQRQVRCLANAILSPNITSDSKKSIISLINKYCCGKKAVIDIRLHSKSIPSMPHLSRILGGQYGISIIMPKITPETDSNAVLEAYDPPDHFVPENGKVENPNSGCQSPIIYSADMCILSSTTQLTLFNPLNIPIFVSKLEATASHNGKHIGDIAAPEDWNWTFEPGMQVTPKIPVTWSILEFGKDPGKGFSMLFDGWKRSGEVSVDVVAKANVKLGDLELGMVEASIDGIATQLRM